MPVRETAHVTLNDLQSDTVALLYEANGVERVEHLVSVPRPHRRIIHIRSVGRRGPDVLPPDFGAAGQATLAGDIEEICAAEDETAWERAEVEAVGHLIFDGPANDAREADIVQRLVRSGPLSIIVLGGDHDLSKHGRSIPDCEYLRVFVKGWPE